MRSWVFWPAIIAACFVSISLSQAEPHNVAQVAGAALAWIVTVSLGWTRWVGRPATWLGQLAAAAGAIILVALIHDWLPKTDVFVIYRRNCPPRMGSFWPLCFAWLGGAGLQTFALWGRRLPLSGTGTAPRLRAVAWWSLMIAWTLVCALVFVRNINAVALGVSLRGAAEVLGILLGAGGILAGLLWLSTRSESKARRKALADYQAIGAATRAALLALIDSHARRGTFRLLYRIASEKGDAHSLARVGGEPLAGPDEMWPLDDEGQPGKFLLQLPLAGVAHPAWNDRWLTIYLGQHELLVRSYPGAADLVVTAAPNGVTKLAARALEPLAMPIMESLGDDDERGHGALDGAWLLETVPGLGKRLSALTAQPLRVLSMLLDGDDAIADFAVENAILVGGEPELIQGPHEPHCELCQAPMRFLLQFCDVTDNDELGDCGVGYVYGCDAHPEHCRAFVDCY
ncbi:hypothetical protein ASD55_09060 [Rhodanobacter sp. Root561]|nr:hypothetical protein ASD55_09060 [Rhodanobacter sp. Root561]